MIAAIAIGILFLGGVNWRHVRRRCVGMLAVGFVLLDRCSSPYRMQRIFGFLDPWADPFGKGYQLSHSLIAFGRGEMASASAWARASRSCSTCPRRTPTSCSR